MQVRFFIRDLFYLALASAIVAAWLTDSRQLDEGLQSVQAEIANSNLEMSKLTQGRFIRGYHPLRVYGFPVRVIGSRSMNWREETIEPAPITRSLEPAGITN